MYKHCAIDLTPIVTHICNLTLSCGHLPAAWKHSIVTPIPKVNPPQQPSDLRHISVTPILSRCFEKLFVKHHFFPALPASNLQDQFAFRPIGSTTNALIHIFGNVTRLLDSNSYVRCIFIDFSKASIRFVMKFYSKNLLPSIFPQYVINWLGHFLTVRTQSVGQSASLQIIRSIVQGSGIGPYAFLVMIADLQPSHPDICYSKYADDLTAVIPAAISHLAVSEFRHINDWSATNKLLIIGIRVR